MPEYGVIEHERPPRCPESGMEAEPVTVKVGSTGEAKAYQATCPACDKTLWLNKISHDNVSLVFYFPEHIGKTDA